MEIKIKKENDDCGTINGLLSKEEAKNLTAEEFLEIAEDASEILWNEGAHRDACGGAIEQRREKKEREMIKNTPEKGLSLLIETLKYDKNKELLEKLL